MSAAIHWHAVGYNYREVEALRGLELAVPLGGVFALLGRNGSGKTTALRLAMGMLRPAEGRVEVLGRDPWRDGEEVKRRIGYVAEEQVLPPLLRVGEVFAFYRACYSSWDERLARDLVSRLQLPTRRRIGELSRGQARQAALIAAVAHRPELLILDEPAGGLDVTVRRAFLEVVVDLLAASGTTVVMSSHVFTDIERLATRVGIIIFCLACSKLAERRYRWMPLDLPPAQ
jgi:ABC-2 type transport system ATP-binding protein